MGSSDNSPDVFFQNDLQTAESCSLTVNLRARVYELAADMPRADGYMPAIIASM